MFKTRRMEAVWNISSGFYSLLTLFLFHSLKQWTPRMEMDRVGGELKEHWPISLPLTFRNGKQKEEKSYKKQKKSINKINSISHCYPHLTPHALISR